MNVRNGAGIVGVTIAALAAVSSVGFMVLYPTIIAFAELNLSPDGRLSSEGQRQLVSMYYFGMGLLMALGLGLMSARDEHWRAQAKGVFLEERLFSFERKRHSPAFTLAASSLIGAILFANLRYWSRDKQSVAYCVFYCKDRGLLDLFVPLAMVASAVMLGLAVAKLWKRPELAQIRRRLSAVYLLFMALFLIYAGEETSWGQDFFRWQTPEVFAGNVEGQTNIHNYFNAYFDYAYIALSLVLVVVIVSAWLESRQLFLPFNRLILPHPSLIGLGALIAFVSIVWYQEQELLEEMLAVFVLFYSLRIHGGFRARRLLLKA